MRRITFGSCLLAIIVLMAAPQWAFSQFIVHDQQYRCPTVDPQCAKSAKKLKAFEAVQTANNNTATINYVEVMDNGDLWDPRQLTEALAQIEKAREGGKKPIVFVYIHGWQNNADEMKNKEADTDCVSLNGDVAKFRTCGVKRLAEREFAGQTRPVVGIYLAWRGLSTNVEPFKHFISYWPRRNKAHLVGRKGMFDALDAIVKKVGEHRDDYTLLMLGHSFGARVLEYAAEAVDEGRNHCGFMERFRLRFQLEKTPNCPTIPSDASLAATTKSPVDLFVYVNAATTHRMTYKALDDWKWICDHTPSEPVCRADPMYLATSSRTDFATSFLLPVADAVLPALKADHLHLISAANTPWLHTHDDPKKVKGTCQADPESDSFCFDDPRPTVKDPKKSAQLYYTKVHRKNAQRYFWIFNTGHRIIPNHGDVWNERVFNLVMAVLDRRMTMTAK
jgi:pimeloyl-ACP methyl ester carboxylesterase